MSHSYGRNIGRSVRVRPGQKIISVLVDEEHVDIAKQALMRANSRIGVKLSVRIGTDVETIGTRPKKTRDIRKAEADAKAAEAEKEGEEAEKNGKAEAKGDAKKGDAKGKPEAKGDAKKGDAKGKPEAKGDAKKGKGKK